MDIKPYFVDAGQGENLMLLHGNGESCEYFAHQIHEFSSFFRVIALDTRGHGKTPRGDGDFSLERFADDLFNFMDENKISRASILGFSDGGNIAIIFTLKHPEMVDKLILNGANMNPRGVKKSVQIPVELGYILASVMSKFDNKAIKKKEILGLMVSQPDVSTNELKKIVSPTLVIVGKNDMIRESHSRHIAEAIPGCRFVQIEGDHFIAEKNSAVFNREVLRFLLGE